MVYKLAGYEKATARAANWSYYAYRAGTAESALRQIRRLARRMQTATDPATVGRLIDELTAETAEALAQMEALDEYRTEARE